MASMFPNLQRSAMAQRPQPMGVGMAARPQQAMRPAAPGGMMGMMGGQQMAPAGRGGPFGGMPMRDPRAAMGAAGAARGAFGAPAGPPAQSPMMGQVGQAGAQMLSDERSKTEIEALRSRLADLGDSPDAVLDEAGGRGGFERAKNFEYEYKPEFKDSPGAGHGRFVTPMAQDLEGIPGVVSEGKDGMKRVDPSRLSMATAGEVGSQRRELDDLRARLADLEGNPDAVLDVAGGRR